MWKRTVFLITVIAMVAATSIGAFAADGVREAKSHAEKALRQYNLGNFEGAIAEFSKAYEIDPSPTFLFNLGQAHRHQGNFDRAVFFYRRYLDETKPDAASRDEAQRYIRELEETVARQKATKEKPPVAAKAPAMASSPPPAAPPPREAGAPSPSPVSVTPVAPLIRSRAPDHPSPTESSWSGKRTLAWTTGGAAVIALGAGLAFQLGASGRFSEFDGGCVLVPGTNMPVPDPSKPGKTQSQCASLYDSWKSDNRWAVISYVSGGALAVTSAILFMTSHSEAPSSGVQARLSCRPGPGVLLCSGAF